MKVHLWEEEGCPDVRQGIEAIDDRSSWSLARDVDYERRPHCSRYDTICWCLGLMVVSQVDCVGMRAAVGLEVGVLDPIFIFADVHKGAKVCKDI